MKGTLVKVATLSVLGTSIDDVYYQHCGARRPSDSTGIRARAGGPDHDGPQSRALVGLGSYIVNAQSGCNDCHTNPPHAEGGDPFAGQTEKINAAGYLGGGTAFLPSPFVSRNLTPRASDGRPAGLTLEQFLEVMHKGTDFKNRHPQISPLLQIMPWPVFGKMSDRELQAVYEYLRAIPCVGSAERCEK